MNVVDKPGQLHGTLAGDGSKMVRAVLYLADVPTAPPESLAELATPTRDVDGSIIDWHLEPGRGAGESQLAAFGAWRSGYVVERFLGERALIRALLQWAHNRVDLSSLAAVASPAGHVELAQAMRMRHQLAAARPALVAPSAVGFGLFTDPNRHSALRVAIPSDPPTILLGLGEAVLLVDDAGLLLQRPSRPDLRPTGWDVHDGHAVAATADGPVDLGSGPDATVLELTGRRAPHIDVRSAPLASLLAPVLVFLADAVTQAAEQHTGLYFRSG